MRRMVLAALFVTLASMWLWAQKKADRKEMKHDHPAAQAKGAPPAPEMTRLLKIFSGAWTTSEKFEPGPMAPHGGTSHGSAIFKAGPGDNSMIEEYTSPHGALGPFHGIGVTWWDASAGTFKGTWCDSMSPNCMVGGMRWQGDKIVGIPQDINMGDHTMVMTSEYRDFKPTSITYTMGMGATADQAKTTMTIVYTKAGKGVKPAAKK